MIQEDEGLAAPSYPMDIRSNLQVTEPSSQRRRHR